ncbi:hypothetical protein GCM10020219_030460 [Nonomuraea dietziae]
MSEQSLWVRIAFIGSCGAMDAVSPSSTCRASEVDAVRALCESPGASVERTNYVITGVWGLAFLVAAVAVAPTGSRTLARP